jgi:hypothetical protein
MIRQGVRLGAMALLALLGLTGCDAGRASPAEAKILARQAAIDPPQLWRVEALGETGAVRDAVYVCADTAVRETFTRTRAEVNGFPCRDTTSPKIANHGWALLCVAQGMPYAVSASTIGDPARDFRLNFGLTQISYDPALLGRVTVRQSRHFQRVGACPAGWRIGDQAKPGKTPHRA